MPMPAYLYFDASGFGAAATPDKKNLEETLECELAAWPQVTPHALRVQAQKIQFWLEMLESRAADCAAIAWRERFADERYIHADHNVPSPGDVISRLDPSGEALKLVCCRGLYFYLKNGERFQLFHANLLRLYAAWQWYHLVKERLTNPDCQKQPAWVDEMGTAYRELWQTLHLEEVRAHNTLVHLVAASNQDAKVRTPDLLERLRLQMVMEAPAAGLAYAPPIEPLALFAETIPWARLRLHPIFRSNEAARAAVRALALETSLGSYDFETGLRLANLLTGRRLATGPLPLWAWAVLVVGLVLGPGLAWAGQAPPFAPPGWDVALAYGGGLLALAGLFFYFLDARSLPRLLMPRLLGGIGIGFSALVIQSDPILLSNALWRGGGWAGVAAVWLAAWGVCALYGFSDIRPRVKSSRQVGKRVLALVVVFSLFALVAGLLILPFPTAAFYEKLWQPDWLWLGPTGWVSLPLWLAFSPLALLMGIFTQFLFEDKAVTVSSWPLETE